MRILRSIALMIAFTSLVYVAAWTAFYMLLMGFDFSYYGIYLYYAWTRPGEVPGLVQFFSLGTTLIAVAVFLVIKLLVNRYR